MHWQRSFYRGQGALQGKDHMKKPNRTAMIGPNRVKPGDKVHIICRHVASSGMSRRMDFYLVRKSQLIYITGHVADITGYKQHHRDGALKVSGCGMDMGFAVVYDLSRRLFPRGYYLQKGDWPRNNDETIKATGIDASGGGYALTHQWI